ncbi:hypothetical protein C1H46_010292 [Malus baccata]|uniref:Uncharacterized protein n=1 Tax=Malus baccata TaxID=106549 RepID=A0A540MZ64_MALBA|nr:hypothetical protein C1H46_010292 [Malus baccata]
MRRHLLQHPCVEHTLVLHSLGHANLEVAPPRPTYFATLPLADFRSGISGLSFNVCNSVVLFGIVDGADPFCVIAGGF